MPKYERHPYLYVTDGEEEVYLFGVADLLSERWNRPRGWWDKRETRRWLSPRNIPGWKAEINSKVGGGLSVEQEDRVTRTNSSCFEVPACDREGFWDLLNRAASESAVENRRILA
jgi:hypothetical protein